MQQSSSNGLELTDDEKMALEKLSGIDKAAILMLSLSEDDAAALFRNLQPKQVQKLGIRMAELEDFNQDSVNAVHKTFLTNITKHSNIGLGSSDFVKNALVAALGEDKANNLVDQISMGSGSHGLDSLKWMDARQVATIIQNEHPQIQTIVLSYLDPEQSAQILSQFPETVRLDLIMRIATLEEVQPAALQELNEIMEKQFAGSAGTQTAKIGGLKSAANIMNYLDNNTETQLMDAIQAQDKEMGQQIQDLMFVFENLGGVDDRSIQLLVREVPSDVLEKALKGADENLREKFYQNMSTRAREALKEDLESMGPTKISDVEAAQKEILAIAHKLADAGQIVLSRGGGNDDFIE
ncbi:MAG TPA: flagellar motor switch protein FliG [Candidatus Anaerobiospirillum pullistercoris]|uniref:Flagellar motor switch protein FliG n=1 Tax=Candidatus Anaerobiospirillum pullistercoris TaxID=2838452 RepID=A0A9D2B189_9GAMM|nr:flagellar motor switch protein FliG [Candidatus Anaerobiospirillum pullistercoris]